MKNQPSTRSGYKISIPGSFTIYQQEDERYCIPACIKSVLMYIKGSSPSQDTIAADLDISIIEGIVVTKIAGYLNDRISGFYYTRTASPQHSTMCNDLYLTVVESKKPCLLSVVDPTGQNWRYRTAGHRVVVNAIQSDKSKIYIADPLGGTNPGWPYYYEMPPYSVSAVCQDIIW